MALEDHKDKYGVYLACEFDGDNARFGKLNFYAPATSEEVFISQDVDGVEKKIILPNATFLFNAADALKRGVDKRSAT